MATGQKIVLKSGDKELKLDELHINTQIVSGVAVSTVDMVKISFI